MDDLEASNELVHGGFEAVDSNQRFAEVGVNHGDFGFRPKSPEVALSMFRRSEVRLKRIDADARGANCRKLGAMQCLKCGIWSAAKGLTTQHVDEKSQYKFQSQ